ncbi:MAG TPA: amidase family protein [Vicinamibacterales bacterium]|jgi:amidase|nr:amidase family protein [Vicinamibacterales bacterium]
MQRARSILQTCSLLAGIAVVTFAVPVGADRDDRHGTFDLVETTIPAIQRAADAGIISTRQLVQQYLRRIAAYDGKSTATHLNSYIHLNPEVLEDADDDHGGGDQHRDDRTDRDDRPLRGIPMILKDNIDTRDMPTTAGSVAFNGSFPKSDSFVARRVREAGAIILGKATMTEFANFLTNGMPAGYSSLGGYGYNAYDPRPDPRTFLDAFGRPTNDGRPTLTPGGSSSGPGIAVSSNLAAVGIGTETSGSILSPGTANGLVGVKPTVGLVSRDGIVPIAADQDTAGPLARTVRDAAIVLGVIAGFDPNDPATAACLTPGNCFHDYTKFLNANALVGARIAVPPFPTNRADVMNNAITVLRAHGATVDLVPALANQLPGCPTIPPAVFPPAPGCSTVLNYAFKRDLNKYIAAHVRSSFPIKSLQDVVNFNIAFGPGATKYGQDLAIFSELFDTSPGSADTLRYMSDRAQDIVNSRSAIHQILDGPDGVPGTSDDYDALLFSGNSGAATPAKAGYPSIVVPGGFFDPAAGLPPSQAYPTGFNPKLGPAGVTFSGAAFSEPRLLALAYAFEQVTHYRVPPASVPPLPGDHVVR